MANWDIVQNEKLNSQELRELNETTQKLQEELHSLSGQRTSSQQTILRETLQALEAQNAMMTEYIHHQKQELQLAKDKLSRLDQNRIEFDELNRALKDELKKDQPIQPNQDPDSLKQKLEITRSSNEVLYDELHTILDHPCFEREQTKKGNQIEYQKLSKIVDQLVEKTLNTPTDPWVRVTEEMNHDHLLLLQDASIIVGYPDIRTYIRLENFIDSTTIPTPKRLAPT
ncbi:hypothetical protein BLNAU_93 [Blattamonas nauphoetae]|uniref:Uncharacterized protein n=1 Tax=Blattamonas nauphoetae TaxID=2049346 RepID=A0ABQ9YM15_9EUKA|nr:hypothetical protein BLNAU_93 [Blattamonas nauphoetae]